MVEDNEKIKGQILEFFKSHWTAPLGGDDHPQGSHPTCSISKEENKVLTRLVSAGEVCGAL